MGTMRLTRYINAPRAKVYATLLDESALPKWRVPDGMTAVVHTFEPREGGRLRVSLTYDAADSQGKSAAHTDTYHGTFTSLVPNERIVEVDEFESDNPALRGAMTITITLADRGTGTELTAVHEGLPSEVSEADNLQGWQMSLAKLARMLET